jgi:quercetin dioxygenase-like cupin family protein
MKKLSLATIALLGGTCAFISTANAQRADHQMTTADELKWAPVPSIPGAQMAVMEGPMNKAGAPFTARLKFPANSKVPPHWHSTIEHVTVISGVMNMGVGDKFDTSKTEALGPGSVSIMQPGTHHFASFSEDTIIQLHGIGPWTVSYVDPANDPRNQAKK